MDGDNQNDSGQQIEVLEPIGRSEMLAHSAEISQQVTTARAYPRRTDPIISREIVSRATLNEDIAGECMFLLPRGGKTIPGPSIRFAEIVRASYGNIRVATRFVRLDVDDPSNAAVIVEAIAYDMQTNNSETVFERRSVMTSSKKPGEKPRMYSPDMIAQTAGAARSIARRNATLAVVPKAVWIDGYHAAVGVARGGDDTLQVRRDKAFDAFAKLGVKPAALCSALGVKEINEVTLEHMPSLMAMYAAIRDGETAASVLDRLGAEVKHDVVSNPLKEPPQAERRAAEKQPDRPLETIDGKTGEIITEVTEQTKPHAALPSNEMQQTDGQKPEAAQAQQPAAKTEADPQEPQTAADYEKRFLEFLDLAKSESSIRDTWGRSAPMRKKLGVDADAIERMATAKEKAMQKLRPQA